MKLIQGCFFIFAQDFDLPMQGVESAIKITLLFTPYVHNQEGLMSTKFIAIKESAEYREFVINEIGQMLKTATGEKPSLGCGWRKRSSSADYILAWETLPRYENESIRELQKLEITINSLLPTEIVTVEDHARMVVNEKMRELTISMKEKVDEFYKEQYEKENMNKCTCSII